MTLIYIYSNVDEDDIKLTCVEIGKSLVENQAERWEKDCGEWKIRGKYRDGLGCCKIDSCTWIFL